MKPLTLKEQLSVYKILIKACFKRKNKLILLGAGAVLDIGGPLTICNNRIISNKCCLTHHILDYGIFITPKLRLVEAMHAELSKLNTNPNFEDIIDFIENTIISISNPEHYSYSRYYQFLINNLQITIEAEKFIVNSFCTFNESIKNEKDAYVIILKDLHAKIINAIRTSVIEYESKTNVNFDKRFMNWFSSNILPKHKSVNIYTLNYDSYLFNLITQMQIPINLAKPNNLNLIKKINYYNLHGSTKWKVAQPQNKQSYQVEFDENVEKVVSQIANIADDKTLMSPIITGRSKVNKLFAKPFQDIINRFSVDAQKADEIYLIGYSFMDNHINSVLRKSLEINPHAKVVVINPGWNVPQFVEMIYDDLKFYTRKENKFNIINPIDKLYEIEGSNMRFFYENFIDFLVNPRNDQKLVNSNLTTYELIKQRFE